MISLFGCSRKNSRMLCNVMILILCNYILISSEKESTTDEESVLYQHSQLEPKNKSEIPSFRDTPVQIVKPDEEHKKLVLVKENMNLLKSIRGPVATVAVVGKFHSGKSFLMNQLMGKTSGFGIGPSVRPETMGIWMWGKPVLMTLASGLKVSVVFLDTEGFAANNVSENYDAKIFAVATLLSSHLLFNSVKIIDQVDIDYLELLARRTQLFALRSQMSRYGDKWSSSFNQALLTFPPLTWVVQDFVQAIGENDNPKQWLHRLMDTHTRENEEYEIGLLGMFKSVDCHTLFLPAVSKRLLSDLSKVTESDLTPEYRRERDELIEKLKREIVPKDKNNRPINGAELAALLELLVNAANEGSLAEVPSRWEGFIQKLEQTAVEDCRMFYESELSILQEEHQNGPVREKVLREWHVRTLRKSLHLLEQLLHGLDEANTAGQKKLEEGILLTYEKFHILNDKKLKLRCSELQHQVELQAEEGLSEIELPVPSSSLLKHINLKTEESLLSLKDRLAELVEEEHQEKYVGLLKKSLQSLSATLQLENTKALEQFYRKAIDSSLAKFKALISNSNQYPYKPGQLKELIASGNVAAQQEFIRMCEAYKWEGTFKPYFAMLKSEIEKLSQKVEEENEAFVDKHIAETMKELLGKFSEAISDSQLSLPINYADLENRLKLEKTKTLREFVDLLEEYQTFPSYFQWSEKLKDEVQKVCDQRKLDNTKAFTEEVKKPLARAKEIVLLSSDKFSTSWSLKKYIKEVCLLQLDEGKAQSWSLDLKENVVEHFITNDKDLVERLQERTSIWSSIVGFFEWLLWILGIIK